jgi:hypothetical protein
MTHVKAGRGSGSWGWGVILLVTAPIWIAFAVAYLLLSGLWKTGLHFAAWLLRKRLVVFVYSDSPLWKPYIEREILPRLPADCEVLNWSGRAGWKWWKLPVLAHRAFAGSREHTPIALVFKRFRLVRVFRFWNAFQRSRRGHEEMLNRLQQDLLECLEG